MHHGEVTSLSRYRVAFGLALAFGATSCATTTAGRPVPEPRIATADPAAGARTACQHDVPYDQERGCAEDFYGVPLQITHRDEMGDGFKLVGAAMFLDGEPMFDSNDAAVLARGSFPVLSTSVRSGHHDLGVVLVYRGQGHGVFAYLSKYVFRAKASHAFEAQGDAPLTITVVGYERGGATAPLEERPAIRFEGAR